MIDCLLVYQLIASPPTHTHTHTCPAHVSGKYICIHDTVCHNYLSYIDGAAGLPYMQWIISIMYTSDISTLCNSHLCQSYSLPTFLSLSVCLNSFQFVFLSVSLFGCLHCPTVLLDVCLSMCLYFSKSGSLFDRLSVYIWVLLTTFLCICL